MNRESRIDEAPEDLVNVQGDGPDVVPHHLVADLHAPQPWVFWADLTVSAAVGWTAFAAAVLLTPFSPVMLLAAIVAGLALYRGLCFLHEITHIRRRALPGFETAWNLLFGVPLLLPSFTYVGVHQSHHSLSTYGTKDDPEYLPFAGSRRLIGVFALQSAVLIPVVLLVRFLALAPVGLLWPRFHAWLEAHASSFAMNPVYRRDVQAPAARRMRRWELATIAVWAALIAFTYRGVLPVRVLAVWLGVLVIVSFVNTLRVLGAHDYESDGAERNRLAQWQDSIDIPGGLWTELWAPVGLRYHALHHYFPGIPYHNLGVAYRRIMDVGTIAPGYSSSTRPSLWYALRTLYVKARQRAAALVTA